MDEENNIYGLMAEFSSDKEILAATKSAYDHGFRKMDAFAPFPVDGLAEALGRKKTAVPLIVLAGGICGGLGGYFMQWYAMAVSYPLNIGGRPLNSWPMFIPITFELTVLSAAFAAIIGMLALNKLPEPHHPVFNVPEFERASTDKFFLCIQADDPKFDLTATRRFLEMLKPENISEVEK
jgi:Alternative complex III, ActD subunit